LCVKRARDQIRIRVSSAASSQEIQGRKRVEINLPILRPAAKMAANNSGGFGACSQPLKKS
jgi:hypothetical protein